MLKEVVFVKTSAVIWNTYEMKANPENVFLENNSFLFVEDDKRR